MPRIRLLVVAAVLVACGSRTEGLDRTKIPDDLKLDYDLFAHKCSKCHGLARPLQSGITDDEQWVAYVHRMRRQPGSGINYEDEVHILRFLRYYAAELRAKQGKGGPPDASAPVPAATPSPSQSPSPVVEEVKDGGG